MKRLMSIIMTFSLCLSLFPAWALAADPDPGLCDHHTEHTAECGYIAAGPEEDPESGHPCEYECKLCPLEAQIEDLPDAQSITADNRDEIQAQLNNILALYTELSEDEQAQIDIQRCEDLQAALDATNSPAPTADAPVVKFRTSSDEEIILEDGGCYTASGKGDSEYFQNSTDENYFVYSQGTLTIHNTVDLDCGSNSTYILNVANGPLTITGDENASLILRSTAQSPIATENGGSIVLDGAVNFTVEATAVPVYTTAESYSGTVTVNGKSNGGKSNSSDSTDQAVAELINGGTTSNLTAADFANTTMISNAFSTGGTITLLADVTMPSFDMECKGTTLDLNGHTLRNTEGSDAIHLTSGGLTIQDSSTDKTGKIESTANGVNVTGGYLEIKSGTFTSTSVSGKAFIIESDSEQSATSKGGKAVLSGGTFSSIQSKGSSLRSRLKEGFAFYQNGQILTTGIDIQGELSDVTIQSCPHVYDNNGTCQACGTKAMALVTINGTSTGYGNIQDAWAAVNGKTATLKILKTCDVGDGLTLTGGNVTLEMERLLRLTKEYKRPGSGSSGIVNPGVSSTIKSAVITVDSGTLTIESADIDGSSMESGIEINGGTLNVKSHLIEYTSTDPTTLKPVTEYAESTSINGGTAISVRGGEVNVSGGSISGTNCGISLYDGVYVGTVQLSGGTVQLSGGTVGATAPKSAALCNYKEGGTVADMLAPGYGLRKQTFNSDGSTSDGDWVNTSTGETEAGRFTVKEAPFAMDATETVNAYYGQTITLNAKVTDIQDGRTVSYQWADSNGTIANATAATYTLPGNLDVGTYTYTCTATSDDGYTKTKTVTVQIAQSGAQIDRNDAQMSNQDGMSTTTFRSSDTITVKVKATPTGSAPSAPMRAARAANQMALYVGDKQVSDAVGPDADDVYTMTVAVPDLLNATGQNADGAGVSITLTARYTGNDNLGSVAQTFSVTVTDDNAATNNDAAIVDADGTIVGYIATLSGDAFNSKSKDKTIKLLRDVVKKSIYIKSSYTFTLDLNGHTIENSSINLYTYNPTLTIQDSAGNGVIKCNNNNFPIKVDCGSLTIDGGTFRSDDTTTIYVHSGNLTINGGKVTSGCQQTIIFYGNELTIHGGTFENASSTGDSNFMGTITVGSANTATIDGGTFNSNTSASALLVANSKLVQISDGSFRGTTDSRINPNYRRAISITQTGKTVGDLLAPGYAFKKNGGWVNDTSVQTLVTDQNTPVTVEKAPLTIDPKQPTEQLYHGLAGEFKLQMNATLTDAGTGKTIEYTWQDTTDAANPQNLDCTADAYPLDLNALAAKTYTYTCTASCDGYSVSHAFTFRVAGSGTTFEGGVKTLNGNKETTEFTTDDTITVQVNVQAATGGTSTNALRAAPEPNQIALFVGETQVSEPVSKTDTIQIAATALLTNNATPNGDKIPLTVKFVGDNNMADHQETVDITITADAELSGGGYVGALSNAFTEATDGKTIKLIRDITTSSPIYLDNAGTFTLDLNGHTIQKTGETTAAAIYSLSGKLTIQDSSTGKTGIIEGYQAVFYYSGNLKLMGGTFKSTDTVLNCAVVTMNGSNAVKNLLEKGYAFYDRNGNLITDQTLLSANQLAGPVTVKQCTHTGLKELDDGVNHGGTCPICEQPIEEPHVWNDDEIPTCTICGATAVIKVQPYNNSDPWRYLSNLTNAFTNDTGRIRVLLSDVDLDGGSVESTISGTKLYLNGHSIKNGEFHISGGSLDINIPNRDKPDGVADGGSIANLHVDSANGANLYGGTYGYIQVDNKGTVGALLEKACQVDDKWQPGYAFYDASDNLMISDETLLDQPMITNVTVKPCTHHFGEDDVCTVCGYQHVYVVSVEINGTTTKYDDIYEAWEVAQNATKATVTLLKSIDDLEHGLKMTKGSITLTLPSPEDEGDTGEGPMFEMYSIDSSDPAGTIQVSGGTLTLENAFINNNGDGPAIDVSGGKLIVPETYFFMGPYMNVACMAMKGGAALYVHDGGQAELSGGMFAGIPSIQSDVPVLRTLKTDYAFCNLNMETGEFYWRYDTSGTELDGLIYVLPAPVTFTEQPKNTEIPYGETPTLSVKPELTYPEESTEDMITYQWYEITADPDDPTRAKPKVIDGATQSTYKPQGLSAGTHVYACGVFFVENNYSGYIAMSDFATVTVTPKELTPRITVTNNATEKVYDGTIVVPVPSYLSIQLSGVLTGDEADVQATVDGYVYDSADVGNRTITARNIKLSGSKAANYKLSSTSATIAGTITPKTVSNPTIELTPNTVEYDGTAKTPAVTVKDGTTEIPSSEYQIAYSDNIDVGTASVTITDKADGNYTVSGSATFTITPSSLTDATVNLSPTSYIYDGTAKTPAVTVEKNNKTLNPETDYDIAYTDNIEIGAATVTITGKGNYTGTITATFQIKPEPIVPVPVTGVKLDKDRLELTVDDIANLTATITPDNADNQDVTWTSSDPDIASVDTTGKITAIAPGNATITATTADGGHTATCTVTVSPKPSEQIPVTGIKLNKNSLAMTVGDTETLIATIEPDTAINQEIEWTSGNPDVATVDQTGKITAIAPGVATITATTVDGGHTTTCTVTVNPKVEPPTPVPVTDISLNKNSLALTVGDTETLIATITPSNADNQEVTWTSGNSDAATVDEAGKIMAVAPGVAMITATTVDGGHTATCTVTVNPKVEPPTPVPVTGISLNKNSLALTVGDTETLIATITPDNADNQAITWTSGNSDAATVDQTGKIMAIAPGVAMITATTVDGGHTATCTVTVNPKVEPPTPVPVTGITLIRTTLHMVVEDTERLIPIIVPENADNQDVTWTSSNPAIATVDETGKITAIAPGTATITVTSKDGGFSATCTVTVQTKDEPYVPISVTGIKLNHSNLALIVEDTERLIPIITPENADNQDVTWTSSNPAIATVDETGKITAIAPGTTTITATTIDGNHKATCTITVKARYHISGIVLQNDTGVSGAIVTLKQGNTKIAEWTTDANGHFDFKDIPSGVYNLVVEKDGITKTVLQEISDHDATLTITLPNGKTNSVVEIKHNDNTEPAPQVVVGGLDEIFTDNTNYTEADKGVVNSGGSVEFKLTVEQKTEESSDPDSKIEIGKIKAETEQRGQTVELFLDLSILKTVTDGEGKTETKINDTNRLIQTRILLPEELQDKENYIVYRVHDGNLETLSNGGDPNSEHYEVSEDKTSIIIFARRYSLYAIAYSDSSNQPDPPTPVEPEKPTDQTPSNGNSNGTSGTSSVNTYAITIHDAEHGSVTASHDKATSGNQITLTVKPDNGYVLDKITATDSRENQIKLTGQNGTYRFTMPARTVDITAVFVTAPVDQVACDGGEDCPSRNFTDLGGVEAWYHEAVDYVLKNNFMNGYGNGLFGPNNKLSRAHLVQILYNQAGRPVVNYLLQYNDVTDGSWYTEAIRWATSQGIVSGYSNGLFGPNNNITREQLAVILWRYAGSPAVTDSDLSFTDANQIGGYALDALRWAVKNGIVNGKSDGTFDPKGSATRAQTAQMFRNYLIYQQTAK